MSGINYNGGHCCHFQILLFKIMHCQFREGFASLLWRKRVLHGISGKNLRQIAWARLNYISCFILRKLISENLFLCNRDFALCPKTWPPLQMGATV